MQAIPTARGSRSERGCGGATAPWISLEAFARASSSSEELWRNATVAGHSSTVGYRGRGFRSMEMKNKEMQGLGLCSFSDELTPGLADEAAKKV